MIDLAEPYRKVIVAGDRDWSDYEAVKRALSALRSLYGGGNMMILTNGLAGAESLAQKAANELGLAMHVYRPQYDRHGTAALYRAHRTMLDLNIGDVTLLLVFEEKTKRDTRDLIRQCERAGIPWQVIRKEVVLRG